MMRIAHPILARPRSRARGFTLLEAMLATVIIGVGVCAMVQLLATGTMSNLEGAELTTGMNLARNVREKCLSINFANMTALNGTVYNPAIDSTGASVSGISNWTQTVSVTPVDPDRLTLSITDSSPSAIRATVTVKHNGNKVYDLSWYMFLPTP
jgi:prepilin-type N-terminal cleavage/methylation domain-containing protein